MFHRSLVAWRDYNKYAGCIGMKKKSKGKAKKSGSKKSSKKMRGK